MKEPSIFGLTTNNFIYWKKMVNYLNILDILKIIDKRYIPRFDENNKELTTESKIDKRNNDYAVNIILNFISKSKEFYLII
jgi:hypothetical protein